MLQESHGAQTSGRRVGVGLWLAVRGSGLPLEKRSWLENASCVDGEEKMAVTRSEVYIARW